MDRATAYYWTDIKIRMQERRKQKKQKISKFWSSNQAMACLNKEYGGDLKSRLVWILNGQKEVDLQMVQILNGIWIPGNRLWLYFKSNHRHIQVIVTQLPELPSRGGLEVEAWTDISLHSTSVGSNPSWVWYIDRSEVESLCCNSNCGGSNAFTIYAIVPLNITRCLSHYDFPLFQNRTSPNVFYGINPWTMPV